MVHGGIDGYSRVIVCLTCANNNRANTVMTAFSEAVSKFGVPSPWVQSGGKQAYKDRCRSVYRLHFSLPLTYCHRTKW